MTIPMQNPATIQGQFPTCPSLQIIGSYVAPPRSLEIPSVISRIRHNYPNKFGVFVSGAFDRQSELASRADIIKAQGDIAITSSWLYKAAPKGYVSSQKRCAQDIASYIIDNQVAHIDLDDVARSHVYVMQTEQSGHYTPGGRHVEFGYAIAMYRDRDSPLEDLCIVGRRENVFQYMAGRTPISHFDTWDEFYYWIAVKAKGAK